MRIRFRVVGLLGVALCFGCSQPVPPTGPSPVSAVDLPSHSRAGRSVPFKGFLEGTQTVTPLEPPNALVNGEATGNATHLGRFTVQFPHTVNFETARGEGTFTFTAANGDTLTADFFGFAQQGQIVSIEEEATIKGGTGRFAGATGAFIVRRQFNPASGVTTGTFDGTISTPGVW
jgi:hypothetical protein